MKFNCKSGLEHDACLGANLRTVIKDLKRRLALPTNETRAPEPFSEFHLFPDLAPELRLNIWNLTAHVPRHIEIEHVRNRDWKPFRSGTRRINSCQVVRVSPRCRRSPVILRVCKESRDEGLRIYTLTNFEHQKREDLERSIFYNPQADVVFFKDNFCYCTMLTLFKKEIEIPSVAINCDRKEMKCACRDIIGAQTPWNSYRAHICARYIEFLNLHGCRSPGEAGDRWGFDDLGPGCKGLKRVFWVVNRNTCQIQSGDPAAPECSSATPRRLRPAARAMGGSRNHGYNLPPWNHHFKWSEGSGPEFILATESQLQAPFPNIPKVWETLFGEENEKHFQHDGSYPEHSRICRCSGDGVAVCDAVEAINVAFRWTETLFSKPQES